MQICKSVHLLIFSIYPNPRNKQNMNFDLLLANLSKHISLTPEETEFFASRLNSRSLDQELSYCVKEMFAGMQLL